MNRYPRSIRYALSTYSNNPKKKKNTSENQRMNFKDNIVSNSFTKYENPIPSTELYDYQQLININQKIDKNEDNNNKTEARQLIEETKKMIEEYSLNKMKQNNKTYHKTNIINNKNNKTLLNFAFAPNLKNNNFENNNKSAIINKDGLGQFESIQNSSDSLTHKFICKNKEIKVLERELKEKRNQLKIAQNKIASKNEEIKKMLDILNNERSNSLKVENSKLRKKIYNLEKNNNDMKKFCDKNLEDLKIKMNNLNNELINYQNRNKELEIKNLTLRKENEKLRKIIDDKNNLSFTLKEKNEIQKKSNEMNNIEINNLKMNLSNIIVLLKTLYNKETKIYVKRNDFLNKLNNLNIKQDFNINKE